MASKRSSTGSSSEGSDSGLSPSDTDSESLSSSDERRSKRRPTGCPKKPPPFDLTLVENDCIHKI